MCPTAYLSDAIHYCANIPDLDCSAAQICLQCFAHFLIAFRAEISEPCVIPHPATSEFIARRIAEPTATILDVLLQQLATLTFHFLPAFLIAEESAFVATEPEEDVG